MCGIVVFVCAQAAKRARRRVVQRVKSVYGKVRVVVVKATDRVCDALARESRASFGPQKASKKLLDAKSGAAEEEEEDEEVEEVENEDWDWDDDQSESVPTENGNFKQGTDGIHTSIYPYVSEPTADPNDWQGDWKDHFKFVKGLMSGAQGSVGLYKRETTGKLFVVKSVLIDDCDPRTGEIEDAAEYEILFERRVQHANIVRLFYSDLEYDDSELGAVPSRHLFYEYCTGGDMEVFTYRWYRNFMQQVPELFVCHVMQSMCSAFAYLHCGLQQDADGSWVVAPDFDGDAVLHRDIKPANIFLRFPGNNRYGLPDVVLADFGMATTVSKNYGAVGTPNYLAPEVAHVFKLHRWYMIDYKRIRHTAIMTPASDIWSLGATFFKLMTYRSVKGKNNARRFANGQNQSRGGHRITYHRGLWMTVKAMLGDEPKSRLPSELLPRVVDFAAWQAQERWLLGERMPENGWAIDEKSYNDGEPSWSSSSQDSDSVCCCCGCECANAGAETSETDWYDTDWTDTDSSDSDSSDSDWTDDEADCHVADAENSDAEAANDKTGLNCKSIHGSTHDNKGAFGAVQQDPKGESAKQGKECKVADAIVQEPPPYTAVGAQSAEIFGHEAKYHDGNGEDDGLFTYYDDSDEDRSVTDSVLAACVEFVDYEVEDDGSSTGNMLEEYVD